MSDNKERFSSRLAFLLSVLGIAIGTGNIWRFPRIVAQNGTENGAGAFIVVWIVFLFLWSIPLIIGEYAIGRKFRKGVIGSIKEATNGKFTWIGAFMALVATAITFFYSVVVGWCIYYFIYMVTNPLPETTESAMLIWDKYQSSYWPLLTHLIALGIGCLAILKGVSSIEKINKVLIPSLLAILVICLIRALTLENATAGIVYLFTPDWSALANPKIWIEALTQNAWDTGAGWGLFLTYAAYMSTSQGIVKNAFFTGIGNNIISLIAAIIIFSTVFSILGSSGLSKSEILDVIKTSGPASTGLTFIWMPQLFAKMLGGNILAIFFFLGLTFAGITSLIAQLELPTKVFIDFGLTRKKSIVIVAVLSFVLGVPSAINLNILSNQDFVWGVALLLSGVFFAIVVIIYGLDKIRNSENSYDNNDWRLNPIWMYIMKFFIPIAGSVLVIWFLADSSMVDDWYHPIRSYSLMTCLVQWLIVISAFVILNKYINKKIKS
jgi:neurotransmitter:Na+ symporter, NSS family